jgi:hypothetical protein
MALPETPQQQLEWEKVQRPRAALAAAAAAILIFCGQVAQGVLFNGAPPLSFLESLQRAARPGDVDTLPSLQLPVAEYLNERAAWLIGATFAEAIGSFALAYALAFLAAATRARRGEAFHKMALYLPVVGGVLIGFSAIARGVGRVLDVHNFLDSPRTVAEGKDIGLGGLYLVGDILRYPAALALAVGIVMLSIQAMRSGLLTRLIGAVGVVVGGAQVIQILLLPLVQVYWLTALAVLFAGRRPGGDPPAWRTGREEPWPTQAELNAKRAAREPKPEPEAEPEPEREPVVAAGPSPSASKRKRKRRR